MRRKPTQHIPPDIRQRAQRAHLGTLQRAYELGKAPGMEFILGFSSILIGCLLIGAFLVLYDKIFSWWPQWQATLIPLIGTCWLGFGVWSIVTPLIWPRVRIYVFSRGLIYQRRKVEVTSWHQVEKLWQDSHEDARANTISTYTIQRHDGSTFALTSNLPGVDALYRFLEDVILTRELPNSIANYKAAIPLNFDEIIITRQGIGVQSEHRLLPWNDVAHITLNDTALSLYRRDEQGVWATVEVADVCNVKVLTGLVEHIKHEFERNPSPHILAYDAGKSIYFGGLTLNKQGVILYDSSELLPWSEIASIGVGESEVMIRRQGPPCEWYTVSTWTIPDIPTLKELLEHILRHLL